MAESKWKRELRSGLEKDYRKKLRDKITASVAAVKAAKAVRRAKLHDVTLDCQAARTRNRDTIKSERTKARERINAKRDRLIGEARTLCQAAKDKARGAAALGIEQLEGELAGHRQERRTEQIYGKGRRKREPGAVKVTGRERREESDSFVEQNLSGDMITAWRAVKDKFYKGGGGKYAQGAPSADPHERFEAFQAWAHDHTGEVQKLALAQIDRDVDEWVAQESEMRAAAGEDLRGMSDQELVAKYDDLREQEGDVPF